MRQVGKRKPPPITFHATAEGLIAGALFNEVLHHFDGAGSTFIPRGAYHFYTHTEANQHQMDCLVKGMADLAVKRGINERR